MDGVVIGHGQHNGRDEVTVPKGLQVRFFTEPDAPLLMVNLLELLKRDNPRTPMYTMDPGTTIPNYEYGPFRDHELLAVETFDELTLPKLVVGTASRRDPIHLCETPAKCPKDGPHKCGGVLAIAAEKGWQRLLVIACRLRENHRPVEPPYLMTPAGRDQSVFDALLGWVTRFVAMPAQTQDTTWEALSAKERIRLLAVEDEIRAWSSCHDLRKKIAADRAAAPALVKATTPENRLRLLRDYPSLRDLVIAEPPLSPEERALIPNFLREPFEVQHGAWYGLDPEDRVRWSTVPAFASWAAAFNACELFDGGLRGENLLGLLRKLDPAAKAIVHSEPDLAAYLKEHSYTI
ncbi:putative adhesin [Actinokineospora enzanensis]|uniref:putative adhesin n=1 Tax=Actinokineospora enzanensis TaxID=155975 RepID=UPI00036F0D65|nr:hypothetical protein [Actinokineospora enzanensis]